MTKIDTSAETVERLAAALGHDQSAVEDVGFMLVVADNPPEKIAATLRALAAERVLCRARNADCRRAQRKQPNT